MPMRAKVDGIEGQIVKPFGRFNYGDIVKVIKVKISNIDFLKSKVCVCDELGCYWLNMSDVKLMVSEDYSA